MKLRNIVVATDLTDSAEAVYRWALALARRFDSRITLFNVDETNHFPWPPRTLESAAGLRALLDDLSRQRTVLLDEAQARV